MGDLHGNQVAAFNQAGTAVSDAFAYDAWGVVVASVTSALPTPWRYQGRMLESAAGTPDLYDFQARSYNPALGTFTSLDSKLGSAQNTALLNGYLYANANPATLVDPDGHSATDCPVFYCGTAAQKAANAAADTSMQKAMKETPREAAKSGSCTYLGGGSGLYCVNAGYDGSQMATTSTTTYGMTTSTTSTTTYGMTTSATVSNTTAGKTTTTTSNTSQAAAAANQGCDPNPFAGNSCVARATAAAADGLGQVVSNVTGTANQIWQNTGGAAVNYASEHLPGTVGICFGVNLGAFTAGAVGSACFAISSQGQAAILWTANDPNDPKIWHAPGAGAGVSVMWSDSSNTSEQGGTFTTAAGSAGPGQMGASASPSNGQCSDRPVVNTFGGVSTPLPTYYEVQTNTTVWTLWGKTGC